jgi:hypothetical protein
MNVSRVLSTAAKRAPSAIVTSKISQRGFAVAATQQAQYQQQSQSDSHLLVGGVLAAAAAASALAASNEKADCCGIAGVVGGSPDAR